MGGELRENSLRGRLSAGLEMVEAFVNAAGGDPSRCAVFEARGTTPFTDDQKAAILTYFRSWVLPPLRQAMQKVDKKYQPPKSKYG